MLRFEHQNQEAELAQCPEPLQLLVYRFADWSARKGLEDPIITCVGRTLEENKAVGGHPNSCHLWNPKPRAVDFRNHHYPTWQLELVEAWWRDVAKPPRFDVVTKAHGTAPHLHVEQNHGQE